MKSQTRLIIRYAIRETMGIVIMGVALFWSAGRMDWGAGWAALAVMLAWCTATAIVILRFNPDLLAERLGPRRGAKKWDTAIMSVIGLLQLARYVVAGLDQRHAWTGALPLSVQVEALVLCVLGQALMVWATANNRFFSQIVRVQVERGHDVATRGPYRYMRHPGYAGSLVFELAVAVLLGSWWAMAASVVTSVLLVIRTALEDRALLKELPGYTDYARRVRFRLLPGIW
jgi:protein-S-isoprenylcysteine O-methyltransferase Ste14